MKKLSLPIGITIIIIIIAILLFISNRRPIEHVLEANILADGEIIGNTTITINGVQKRKPFTDILTYVGKFSITYNDATCSENVEAKITWFDADTQHISFFYNGFFKNLGIEKIYISKEMNRVNMLLENGEIISTDLRNR